ncbi:hypothetical protein UPYG_G00165300 [Umbra pygmaea]|uniref:Ig-like domain-containing protein n=1 Tax=Umbra pygmaea TaxID=75934 RepID=A0ABD0WMF3_UMBPY
MAAGHLVIFLYTIQYITSQDLPQPSLTVSSTVIRETDSVQLSCETPTSVSVSQCYFYIEGNLNKALPCQTRMTGSNLVRWTGQKIPVEVKIRCQYSASGWRYLSLYSEISTVTIQDPPKATDLPQPSLIVSPTVIRETESVQLSCETPTSVSVSQCIFYIEWKWDLNVPTCQKTFKGSQLLEWAGQRSPFKIKLRCFFTSGTSRSPKHSDPVSLTILGELQKPEISIHAESSDVISIDCVLPESVSDGSRCSLYTGDQPQPYKEAQSIRSSSSIRLICTFSVSKNDLFRSLQVRRDVSCDYRENIDPHSVSPRSDGYTFTDTDVTSSVPPRSTANSHLTSRTSKSTRRVSTGPTSPQTAIPSHYILNNGLTINSTLTPGTTQSSTEIRPNSNHQDKDLEKHLWQTGVGVASAVGVFLVGLTAVCLCGKTKNNAFSSGPQAQQEEHSQNLVMGAMNTGGLVDLVDNELYSVTSTTILFSPSGTGAEKRKPSDNSDIYHVYNSIRDRPAAVATPDGLYNLLQEH